MEHPTPTCPNCNGNKTRPLDEERAVCFDCDKGWRMTEETQDDISSHWNNND